MKKVTVEEFLELVKSDKDLHDSYKAALQEAEEKTPAEVAETLGYQIEVSDLQKLDDEMLSKVIGGVTQRDANLRSLFPNSKEGEIDYGGLGLLLSRFKSR